MGSTELAANLFRATQTEDKLRRDRIQGKVAANRTHFSEVHYHTHTPINRTVVKSKK